MGGVPAVLHICDLAPTRDIAQITDALRKRQALLSTMQSRVLGFDSFKQHYENDAFFGDIWKRCMIAPFKEYVMQEGFLFRGNKLCISDCSLHAMIITEELAGGLGGQFEVDKTMSTICG